jgi:dethiobiotin synthetase
MGISLFITGTGTDVGKTALSLTVLFWAREKGLAVAYYKPVQCGSFSFGHPPYPHGDAEWIAALSPYPFPTYVTYRFSYAVSPHLAAERDGQTVDLDKIGLELETLEARYDLVVMEGVGGLAVPLNRKGLSLAELAADKNLACLLACSSGLGTLHHTLATLAYAQSRSKRVSGESRVPGFAMIHREPRIPEMFPDNVAVLRSLTGMEYFGALPFHENMRSGLVFSPEQASALASGMAPGLDRWWASFKP